MTNFIEKIGKVWSDSQIFFCRGGELHTPRTGNIDGAAFGSNRVAEGLSRTFRALCREQVSMEVAA